MKMYSEIEYQRNRARQRKESGLCPRCGKERDRDGYYCTKCNNRQNEYHREIRDFCRKNHRCTTCRKRIVYGSDKTCFECRAKLKKTPTIEQKKKWADNARKKRKQLRIDRLKAGICTKCGKRSSEPNRARCKICSIKDAEYKKNRRKEEKRNRI